MGRVVHFEIHCDDVDRAEEFYRDVFDWDVQRFEGALIDYRLVITGPEEDRGIDGALMERRSPAGGPGPNASVNTVAVEDIAETESRVVAAGGVKVMGPEEVPRVGLVAQFRDTEGNLFGAIQPVGM